MSKLRLELRLVRSRRATTLSFSSASDGGSYLDSSNARTYPASSRCSNSS